MTRPDELRDILSDSLRDVCYEGIVETSFVPVTGMASSLTSVVLFTDSEDWLNFAASGIYWVSSNEYFLTCGFFAPSPF